MTFVPLSTDQLRSTDCTPLEGQPPLADAAIKAQLPAVPDWQHQDGALRRRYPFKNYYETLAFVNAIAWVIHRQDHHPELAVSYATVDVAFNTHSVKGISINDFICAAQVDAVYGA
jgi:4a-hydroxytetrahydrobiopterin dehydratase